MKKDKHKDNKVKRRREDITKQRLDVSDEENRFERFFLVTLPLVYSVAGLSLFVKFEL